MDFLYSNEVKDMDKKVVTVKEVAGYLNLHIMTIYKLVREGKIPAFKVGGRWRFKKKLLDEWIDKETNKNNKKMEKLKNVCNLLGVKREAI